MEIDLHRLPEMLQDTAIPGLRAEEKGFLDILMHAVVHHKDFEEKQPLIHHHDITTEHRHQQHQMNLSWVYSDEIEDKIDAVRIRLKETYPGIPKARVTMRSNFWNMMKRQKTYPLDLTGITDKCCESQIINEKI